MDIYTAVSYLREALKISEKGHLEWRARERSAVKAVLAALDARTSERDNLKKIIEELEKQLQEKIK